MESYAHRDVETSDLGPGTWDHPFGIQTRLYTRQRFLPLTGVKTSFVAGSQLTYTPVTGTQILACKLDGCKSEFRCRYETRLYTRQPDGCKSALDASEVK